MGYDVSAKGILEDMYRQALEAPDKFKHKAVLFISAESISAPVFCIMQGLETLGWTVYVIGKHFPCSYWFDTIIHNPRNISYDFVLSSLHWGTRWDWYDMLDDNPFKVLIDGADNFGMSKIRTPNWREKHNVYCEVHQPMPAEEVLAQQMQSYRWTVPIGDYEPDIVFMSQKPPETKYQYLPFGIHNQFLEDAPNRTASERTIDFAHIHRKHRNPEHRSWVDMRGIPGNVFEGLVYGKTMIMSDELRKLVKLDKRRKHAHSYQRVVRFKDYFDLLDDSKVVIIPIIRTQRPGWDSRRPWEALARGCLVLFEKPSIDMAQYPVTDLCPFAIYDGHEELLDKCHYLHEHQEQLEQWRTQVFELGMRYFSSVALARYFLHNVWKAMQC